MSFADNLASLPPVDHLDRLELLSDDGRSACIDNRPGSAGSVRIYAYLAEKYGVIDAAAAADGLNLYAEHTDDARAHPGKHANIDRLLAMTIGDRWRVTPVENLGFAE